MNGFFTLTWSNVKSAVIYGVLTAVVTFLLVVFTNIIEAGTIYGLDWAHIIDKGLVAVISVLVVGVSLLKNLLTNSQGKFLGILEVIPDKTKDSKKD